MVYVDCIRIHKFYSVFLLGGTIGGIVMCREEYVSSLPPHSSPPPPPSYFMLCIIIDVAV